MKLYMHPASTTSRPVMHFIAEEKIPCEQQVVDIFKGEHAGDAYARMNPSKLIPMLEDGDFRLTESAAILRYLAEKTGSKAYPKDLQARARVNEALDWFNSQFYRDWGYGYVYPQVFPNLKREDPAVQAGVVSWGGEKAKQWLSVLNEHFLGGGKKWVNGADLSIADYFGLSLVTAGELVHCDFAPYRNVTRWIGAMKARPSYGEVYKVFNGFCESTKAQSFAAL
jgi:glutathione S-transferase